MNLAENFPGILPARPPSAQGVEARQPFLTSQRLQKFHDPQRTKLRLFISSYVGTTTLTWWHHPRRRCQIRISRLHRTPPSARVWEAETRYCSNLRAVTAPGAGSEESLFVLSASWNLRNLSPKFQRLWRLSSPGGCTSSTLASRREIKYFSLFLRSSAWVPELCISCQKVWAQFSPRALMTARIILASCTYGYVNSSPRHPANEPGLVNCGLQRTFHGGNSDAPSFWQRWRLQTRRDDLKGHFASKAVARRRKKWQLLRVRNEKLKRRQDSSKNVRV